MKKKFFIVVGVILALIIVDGMAYFAYFIIQDITKDFGKQIQQEGNMENDNVFNKNFGNYELPENWVESKKYSTSSKFFYVLKGQEQEDQPNNISINYGTNKYDKANHEKFKEAILNQLSMQIAKKEGIEINANGSYNDNEDIVYTFIIKELNANITTTQYYIVGDYKYILIHETVFGESEETDEAAKRIVNSFKWN